MVCQYSREHPLSSENHQPSQERSDAPVPQHTWHEFGQDGQRGEVNDGRELVCI
jgi:hypothetical protein